MNQITFDSESYIDALRRELEIRRQRKIQRRWELALTIVIALVAAITFVYWRAI